MSWQCPQPVHNTVPIRCGLCRPGRHDPLPADASSRRHDVPVRTTAVLQPTAADGTVSCLHLDAPCSGNAGGNDGNRDRSICPELACSPGARPPSPFAQTLSKVDNPLFNQRLKLLVPAMSTIAPQHCPGLLWIAAARLGAVRFRTSHTRIAAAPHRVAEAGPTR